MGQLALLHAWLQTMSVTQPDIQQVLHGSLQVSELGQHDSGLGCAVGQGFSGTSSCVGDCPIDLQISFDIEMSNFISRCPQQLWQVDRQGNASEHRRKLSHRYAKQIAKGHKAMLL